ncbi:dipeptidyl peptidase 2-like isoform X1 [Lingula anatina]|uniref:Dipeptidyl peptidase 2-like isoform X1 n=1 Tax=Lingula anatina TaxID=7574 RepID=A0A1S3K8K2_LINAN|nr:dipeptidyl peptidase 2-like isoform X1 [Lingula anatina]|eukprot:XP_013418576.1 dipeptidyl peptidase 2-like isoform X1 [Lingula anatina]
MVPLSKVPSLLLCICTLFLPVAHTSEDVPFVEKYFDQYLDHFNFASFGRKMYKQRYLIQDQWWQKGQGPIFFYTGNEGPITAFWKTAGFLCDIAPQFKALVIFAEHRFYGNSLPCGKESFKDPCIGLLTAEQALADYAVLLTQLKKDFGAQNVPVIAFGGSYGGILSAYMRFKYPNVIDGAIAASAPLLSVVGAAPGTYFWEDITNDCAMAHPECVPKTRAAFLEMEMMYQMGSKGLQQLSAIFKLCNPLKNKADFKHLQGWTRNAFANVAMFNYPYPANNLPANPIQYMCKLIINSSIVELNLKGLAAAAGLYYNATSGNSRTCFDIYSDFVECADPTGCGVGSDSLAWDFQACTEFVMPPGSDGVSDMFPVLPFTLAMRTEYCQQRWNVTPRDNWTRINYWGPDIESSSNIVFSNGDLDPWHRGGFNSSLSSTLIAVKIEGGAHHLDLRSKNAADPQSVIKARKVEVANIQKWIKQTRHLKGKEPRVDDIYVLKALKEILEDL